MSQINLTNNVWTEPSQEQSDWANHFLRSIEEPPGSSERRKSSSPVKQSHHSHSTTSPLNNITVSRVSSQTKPRWSSENFRPVSSEASSTDNVSSPPSLLFTLQYPEAEVLPSSEQPSPTPVKDRGLVSTSSPPTTPEKIFFEKHNIMKWVIDDQDDGDILGLTSSQSQEISEIALENMKLEADTEVKNISLPETSQSEVRPKRTKRRSEPDLSKLTEAEISARKYSRIRRLNNESSRRCRMKKKLEQNLLLKELEDQTVRHTILKERCKALESKVRNMKISFLRHFKDPQRELALARQRIIFGGKIDDDILRRIVVTRDLPDISSIWSNLQ